MTLPTYNAMPPLAGNETPLPEYEDCGKCGGSGLAMNDSGEPGLCSGCHGDTVQSTHAISEERKRLARIATEYEAE